MTSLTKPATITHLIPTAPDYMRCPQLEVTRYHVTGATKFKCPFPTHREYWDRDSGCFYFTPGEETSLLRVMNAHDMSYQYYSTITPKETCLWI